jgi:TRAP-type C4-dicarboxylate transport system substrate-binding protein
MQGDRRVVTVPLTGTAGAAASGRGPTRRPGLPRSTTRSTAVLVTGALLLTLAAAGQAAEQDKGTAIVMKVSLPTINDTTHQFAKNFAAAVEKDSGSLIKAQIYPASQLGTVPRQIEGVQFGTIECAIEPPEFLAGVDERFEVLAAPGLVSSMEHGQRFAADGQVHNLMFGLGATKGLHGVALVMLNPNDVVARTPINHVADLRGKKLRVFASQFETVPFSRLGVTPVSMSLGDVLPALQQGAIDGALAGIPVLAAMHFRDAAKYVTQIGQPAVFGMVECSKKWFDALPAELQQTIEKDAAAEAVAVNPWAANRIAESYEAWTSSGGEVIKLPATELAEMLQTLSAATETVAKSKPEVDAAYRIMKDAAQRTQ